jgi:hypothetical protein
MYPPDRIKRQVPPHMVEKWGRSIDPDEKLEAVEVENGLLIITTNEKVLEFLPNCRHRMGGVVRSPEQRVEFFRGGVLDALEDGDSHNASVIKHRLPTGRVMILCTRCNKTWYSVCPFTGEPATPGFDEANNWQTTNYPSGSSLFLPLVRSQSEQPVAL